MNMTAEEFVSNVKDEVFKETFEYYFKTQIGRAHV